MFLATIKALIVAAALSHTVSARALDCLAYHESTWGQLSPNLYQLMPGGELEHFEVWEVEQGFIDHNLYDPSRQINFVADQIKSGHTAPWPNTWPMCRNL